MKALLDTCGEKCSGGVHCTSNCMAKRGHFSKKCANCFGSFDGCARWHCIWKCLRHPHSSGCVICVKRHCEASFMKCSGLSSPIDPPTAGDFCNANDKHIWDTENEKMKQALDKCAKKCWGDASCVTRCMMKEGHFSEPCANCFGSFADCSKVHCKWKCLGDTHSAKCIKCVKKYCTDDFVKCSGLSSPIYYNQH